MCFWLLSAASPIKWTHLEIMPIFKLLGMIYLQISTSVSYCSKQLCFMAPMWWVSKLWYMSPVWCYCTKVHFIPKHNILFIFFLSWTNIRELWWLDWMILKISCKVNDSTIQWFYECEWLYSPLKALLFPGLCKTWGATSSPSKM